MVIVLQILTGILVVATLLPMSRAKVWWVRGLDFPRTQIAALAAIVFAAYLLVGELNDGVRWIGAVLCALVGIYQAWWI